MSERVMNLYLVTCISRGVSGMDESMKVYVLAPEPTIARNKALSKMKELDYRYVDWVGEIELLAALSTYAAPNLLVE